MKYACSACKILEQGQVKTRLTGELGIYIFAHAHFQFEFYRHKTLKRIFKVHNVTAILAQDRSGMAILLINIFLQ